MDTDLERRLEKLCGILREMGYSYEAMPDHLESPLLENRLEPWEAYKFANPTKTKAQVNEWRRKHNPGALGDVVCALPPISRP